MRKKNVLLYCFLLLACSTLIVSCSKDDDENGTEDSSSAESVVTPGLISSEKLSLPYGYRLSSWKTRHGQTYGINYNSDGSLKSFSCGDYEYQVNNNPFTIDEVRGGYDKFTILENASFNKKGYITKFHQNFDYGKYEYTMSYNESDRITNINIKSEEYKCHFEGEKHVYDGIGIRWTTSISFNYTNDCLSGVKYESTLLEGEPYGGGFRVPFSGKILYSYENSLDNLASQFTLSQIYFLDDVTIEAEELFEGLFFLGYLGKPTKFLPSKMSYTYMYDYNFDGEGNSRFINYDRNINYTFDKYGVVTSDDTFNKFTFTTVRPQTSF